MHADGLRGESGGEVGKRKDWDNIGWMYLRNERQEAGCGPVLSSANRSRLDKLTSQPTTPAECACAFSLRFSSN